MARVLVTNDDGVESPGIAALARAAARAGLAVTVAAPSWNSSGASASLTAVEKDGRLLVDSRNPDASGIEWYGVEAAPAFIVRAGIEGAFGEPPDLVLSGINLGLNTGAAILHSGTVGAVLTAATLRCRGMAVSLAVGEPHHWETAAELAARLVPWLLDVEAGVVANLNVPNVPLSEVRGVERGCLSSGGTVHTTVTELGKGYVKLTYSQPDEEFEPGSDAALVAQGFASFTPLQAPCEDSSVDSPKLEDLIQPQVG